MISCLKILKKVDIICIGDANKGHAIVGGGKPHGPRFDATKDNSPVDANDEFMLRKLPPMEVSCNVFL